LGKKKKQIIAASGMRIKKTLELTMKREGKLPTPVPQYFDIYLQREGRSGAVYHVMGTDRKKRGHDSRGKVRQVLSPQKEEDQCLDSDPRQEKKGRI